MNTFKLPFGPCLEMHLELPLFFYRQFRFWNWRLVVWSVAHKWPERLFVKDFEIEERLYNTPPYASVLVPPSQLNNNFLFLVVFVLVGALTLNLSTLYSWLSNFDKTCAIFFGKRKQVLCLPEHDLYALLAPLNFLKTLALVTFFHCI